MKPTSIYWVLLLAALAGCGGSVSESQRRLEQSGVSYTAEAFAEAAAAGQLETVRLFLDSGMDPDAEGSDGSTPLMHAARAGQLEVVRLLVQQGCHLDREDRQGRTALDYATPDPDSGVFELLVSEGAPYGTLEPRPR